MPGHLRALRCDAATGSSPRTKLAWRSVMLSLPDDGGAAALARHGRASRRVRLEIGALLGNPTLARDIEASAGGRPGITRVVADPRSGRVLVEYEPGRSEEHTSELQSPCNLVCRLLLEKKNDRQHPAGDLLGRDAPQAPEPGRITGHVDSQRGARALGERVGRRRGGSDRARGVVPPVHI